MKLYHSRLVPKQWFPIANHTECGMRNAECSATSSNGPPFSFPAPSMELNQGIKTHDSCLPWPGA